MSVKAYIPSEVRFGDRPIKGTRIITLYDPDGDRPNGSMTTSEPLEHGVRGGPLVFLGVREGKSWEITLPEIAVNNKTAMGFEYDILAPIREKLLDEDVGEQRGPIEKGLGDYGATF